MSYDLMLFTVPEGEDARLAFQQRVRREEAEIVGADPAAWRNRSIPDSTRTRMQDLADAIIARWGAFVQARPKLPKPTIQLNELNLQLQVTVHEDCVFIRVPYFRDLAPQLMDCIGSCIQVCRDERGYTAYDSQLGRAITAADRDIFTRTYRGMDKVLPLLREENRRKAQ